MRRLALSHGAQASSVAVGRAALRAWGAEGRVPDAPSASRRFAESEVLTLGLSVE